MIKHTFCFTTDRSFRKIPLSPLPLLPTCLCEALDFNDSNSSLGCSFTSTASSFTGVTEVKKFGNWVSGPTSIGKRMPWLSLEDHKSLLTTSSRESEDWHGTIVAQVAENKPAPWIAVSAENPGVIWYWLKEAATAIERKLGV